ncbi:MAG: sodium:solute symporter family protein [Synergistetes bacterium]|nr:sodium:solute symporter family protein [Synergistota bacterium]
MASLAFYLVFLSLIGLWRAREADSFKSYFLSDRRLGMLETSLTLMSTWVDSAIILGFTGYCYMLGYDALWIAIPTSIGVYTFSIIFARKINLIEGGFTVGGVIEKAYGELVSVISSLFVLLYSVTLIATNVMAAGHIMKVMLGVPFIYGALIVLIITVFYTLLGGFKKVVETDIAQFFLVIIGLSIVVIFSLRAVGGWDTLERVASSYPPAFSSWDIFSFFIVFTFPFWANPSFYQRCNAARSPHIASFGVATVGLIDAVMTIVALIVGLTGAVLLGNKVLPDAVFPKVVEAVLPPGVRDLVVIAILSAVMSTADSYLLIAGGVIAHDILRPLRFHLMDEAKLSKLGVLVSACLSFLSAFWFSNIIEAAIFAFSLFVSSSLIPLIGAFYFKDGRDHVLPVVLSMIGGGGAVLFWKILKLGDTSMSVLYGLAVSGGIWFLSILLRKVFKNMCF